MPFLSLYTNNYLTAEEEHGAVRRGVPACERAVASPGDTPSALWHARVCQDDSQATLVMKVKFPPQHKTAALPQYIRSLLSCDVSLYKSHKATSQA